MSTHRVSVAVHAHAWNHLPTLARAALWTPGVTWHAQAARVETEPLDADAVARVTAALDARGLRYVLIPTNARRCRFCGCVVAGLLHDRGVILPPEAPALTPSHDPHRPSDVHTHTDEKPR